MTKPVTAEEIAVLNIEIHRALERPGMDGWRIESMLRRALAVTERLAPPGTPVSGGAIRPAKSAQDVAGEAYQVIAAIADHNCTFVRPEVERALDYFSGDLSGDILPFSIK